MKPQGQDDTGGWLTRQLANLSDFLSRGVWSPDLKGLPTLRAMAYKVTRVLYLALRGFAEDRCLFRASALTYITVLSIVPMLAFAFSVAKGLGAYDRLVNDSIQPFLDSTFGPSVADPLPAGPLAGGDTAVNGGAEVRHAIDQVLAFVKDTDFGSLGFVGLAILLYAVIKLSSSVEQSLNVIWGVRKSRTFLRKVSDYLSMVVVVPILLVTATGITTAIKASGGFLHLDTSSLAPAIRFLVSLSPLVVLWLGFSLVYLFMPNARTRVRSALLGGMIGGSLWQLVQVGHVNFQLGIANYNAIYASFAAFPIFLVWIYFSWVTLLLGAEFAFAHQNEPDYRQIARSRHHDHAFRQVLALRLMARLGARFLAGDEPASTELLAHELGVPERSIEGIGLKLHEHGIVAIIEGETETTLLPARGLEQIRVKQILDALMGTSGGVDFPPGDESDRNVDRILREYGQEIERSAFNRTVHELAQEVVPRAESRPHAPGAALG